MDISNGEGFRGDAYRSNIKQLHNMA